MTVFESFTAAPRRQGTSGRCAQPPLWATCFQCNTEPSEEPFCKAKQNQQLRFSVSKIEFNMMLII